jgi:hypothetical protein
MAKQAKRYIVIKTKHRDGRTYKSDALTLPELVLYYKYTLDTGRSWQHEKGNKKINTNPKSIAVLIKNLNAAVNNAAANGYAGVSFDYTELTEAVETV